MNARKSTLVTVCLAVLTLCSLFAANQQQKSRPSSPYKMVDGGAPLPPIPPHGAGNSYTV